MTPNWLRWTAAAVLYGAATMLPAVELTAQQREWIARHGEVRVAPAPDFAPIDGVDADGRHHGLAADYLHALAERTGLRFRVVPVKHWRDALDALRDRRVDMLPSAFALPDSNGYALFSAPYLRLPCAVFTRTDASLRLDQLDGRPVAVVDHGLCQSELTRALPAAAPRPMDSVTATVDALLESRADALSGDLVSVRTAAARRGAAGRISVAGQIGEDNAVGFAVRSDWPELAAIIDVALSDIGVDEEATLRGRWLKDLAAPVVEAPRASIRAAIPPGHLEEVRAAIAALAAAHDIPSEQRREIEPLLAAAERDEKLADDVADEWKKLRETAAGAGATAARVEQELAGDTTAALLAWRSSLPERASVVELEELLATQRTALADARATVAELQAELSGSLARPSQIREELKAAQAKVVEDSADAGTTPSDPALATAKRLQRAASLRLAQTRTGKLEEELRTYESRLRLTSARVRAGQREASDRQSRVDALQNLILDRASADAAALNSRLAEELALPANRQQPLSDVAGYNLVLGQELARAVERMSQVRSIGDKHSRARRDTEQALGNTQERVALGGVSEAVGLILLAERRKLQPLAALERKLAALQTELAQTRIRLIDLRELGEALVDLDASVEREARRAADGDQPDIRAGLFRLLNERAEIVPRLTAAQTRLADALADAEQELRKLVEATSRLRELLDTRLLWTPSHAPVSLGWFREIGTGAVDLFRPSRWWTSLRLAATTVLANPLSAVIAVTAMLVLLVLRRRVPAMLDRIATPIRRIRTDRYRLSGQALALTLLATLPAALLLWLCNRLWLRAAEARNPFTEAVGLAFGDLIVPATALAFLGYLNISKGLASAHFRWVKERRQALDVIRRWATFVLLPTQFFFSVYFYYNEQVSNAAFARAVFVVVSAGVAWLAWKTLAPGALWSQRSGTVEPNRLRQFLRIGLTGQAIALAVLALTGYYLTAVTLAGRTIESLVVFLAIATLHGMAMRWLVLGERRLALKRLEEKRDGELQREDADREALPEATEAEVISLASINLQTRRLLRAATAVVVVGALLWVWSDVTPALAFLGNITAWQSSYAIDGKQVAFAVTLRSLLFATVAFVLTWIATRNIPGLLEIGVLRRLQVDAPTRYAITAISRYVLVIVGILLGLSLLGVRWTQLQWMAAALSVGLGFGLQEIFANLVSGLIVLFERPMRVGDIIAIGGVEGTVTRIRTRATTVVDWDNKEVVIPNKTFITDKLTNWTLSDSVTRVVIKLSVSSGADPDDVRTLLLELARAQPKVLKDPGPNCWCIALGPGTLDYELRVFVASVLDRNPVRNDMHAAIVRECRLRGIEISFPQLDVTLHRGDPVRTTPRDPGTTPQR